MVRSATGRAGGDPPPPESRNDSPSGAGKTLLEARPTSASERQAIEAMASSIINKLLHAPIVRLKQESQSKGGRRYLQALRDFFSLDE